MLGDAGLGSCSICGKPAGVEYPLLPGSPRFCGEHHNPRDAGRFGCDFSGPDDFDIPVEDYDDPDHYAELQGYTKKQFRLWHEQFIWTDVSGVDHCIKDIDDQYLNNIINFLRRRADGGYYSNGGLMRFLEDEQKFRAAGKRT